MTSKVLAIDAGNTRIKWGLHDGRGWILRGAIAIADVAGGDTFRDLPRMSDIDQILASNVAGASVATEIEHQLRFLRKPIAFISAQAAQCGVVNGYETPTQLGSDRWAALIGAHRAASSAPRAQLVVMAGTALTVDAITADGRFLGGIIVPGVMLMHGALNRGTARLPGAIGEHQIFPTSTVNAITSGAIEACTGAVQRMYAKLTGEIGELPDCIGSGGAITLLTPHLSFPVSINDNLVLDGLLEVARTF